MSISIQKMLFNYSKLPLKHYVYGIKRIKFALSALHPESEDTICRISKTFLVALLLLKKVCYARVSSKKQMDDLDRQKDFFRCNYPNHIVVSDVASGINWKRKGLLSLLESSMRGDISEVVVAHRDRLSRFAFELLEWIFRKNGVELVVLNRNDNQSEEQELSDDVMSIIHVYSCRKNGKRRYKTNQKNTSLSNSSSETKI